MWNRLVAAPCVQDYEMDSLNNLKKILAGKWDFVTMQAEEQVSLQVHHPQAVFRIWNLK